MMKHIPGITAALLVLVAARRATYILAFLVAASALGAVLIYRHPDRGQTLEHQLGKAGSWPTGSTQ